MLKRLLVGLALLISVPVFSQTVAVTSAVTDSQSTLWTSARWQVQFYPNPNQTNICSYQVNGVSICSNTYKQYLNQNGTSDANTGLFTVTLLDNTQINPSGSKWVFTIQSNTSAPAVQYTPVQVTSSTTSLTSFLSSNSTPPTFPALGLGYYGYSDSEVFPIPQPGGFYFNVVNAAQRFWNGSSFTQNPSTSSQNTWTNIQSFSPLNLSFTSGVANNIVVNPTWNSRISSSMTTNTTEYGYNSNILSSRPGIDRGGNAITAPNWTVLDVFQVNGTKYGQGLMQGGINVKHTGPGDTIPWYVITASNGNNIEPDAEGNITYASHIGEGPYGATPFQPVTFSGIVTTGGANATQISTGSLSWNGQQGDSEYLLNLTPLTSGCYFTTTSDSSSLETITTNTGCTFTPSTAYGVLATNITTPVGNPVGVGSTTETLTFTTVTGTFIVGQLGCFAASPDSNMHEQAFVTSVSGSGNSQTVTLNLRQQHPAGSYFFEGGPCGDYIVTDAAKGDGLKYPVDLVGATGTNTLVVEAFGPGGEKYILSNVNNSQKSIDTVTNGGAGTTVTFHINQAGFSQDYSLFNNAATITFSGLSDSSLNTQCTNLTIVASTQVGTCTISGLSGSHSATSGEMALGNTPNGNTTFTVYKGAEILDVQNPTTQDIDGSFTLEPNNTTWTVGATVEAEHLPSALWSISTNSLTIHNTNPLVNKGYTITMNGQGITKNNIFPSPYGFLTLANTNSFSMYKYGGGNQDPLPVIAFRGPWGGNYFQYAPCWGCRSFYIGPPNNGTSDVNYMYYSALDYGCAASTTECGLTFHPATNTWSVISNSEIYQFAGLQNWNTTANAYQAVVTLNSAGTPGHIAQWAIDGGLQDGGILSPTTSTIAWTPAAATVSSCVEQVMPSIPNLVANRMVFVNPPAALGSHVWIGSVRSTGANNITVDFCADATGGTPPSGNWGWGAL